MRDVLEHSDDYLVLVNKNRETAERLGSWDVRIKRHKGKMIEENEV